MVIHDNAIDIKGAGRWDVGTTRYVPFGGGSKSRLPVGYDDIPRYYGFVGMDEKLTGSLNTMAALYHHLGGAILLTPDTAAYITRLLEQSAKWMQPVSMGAVASE